MFKNLRAEMAREGLNQSKMAAAIGVCKKTFGSKMLCKSEFTRTEMFKIQELLSNDLTLDYLFKWDEPCVEPEKSINEVIVDLIEFRKQMVEGSSKKI
ncbi:MAG: hypothetical protein M0T74_13695 [Desulfitobacterium hafniense]|nr:hypothetical protein [Desulfosporosinus sp.]MDA8228722.1 hypothetical protein [Desulfitobacterium hafniense]